MFKRITTFLASNKWLYSAILYPLSWATYSGPNLSFLAWFALVPLFIYLSKQTDNFKKFYGSSLLVVSCWTLVTSGWLFHFPTPKWQIILTIFSETIHISLPFAILFLWQKKIGFNKSLILFPFIWIAWEWLYIPLQHTMGTHLIAYSQGNNLWLIQMADIGGMWLVGFWVMMFNVALYFSLRSIQFEWHSQNALIAITKVCGVMIIPILLYSYFSIEKWSNYSKSGIQISIIPTQFESSYLTHEPNQRVIIENTLHRTDSLAFELIKSNRGSDLYVWPEAGTSYWSSFSNITKLLYSASTDWGGSLLTGCKGIPIKDDDNNAHISAVMISPKINNTVTPLQYHHKTVLVPGSETIPYKDFIMPLFDTAHKDKNYFSPGTSFQPLQLKTKQGAEFKVGISLCYEQWFPSIWARQAINGAEFFVHMAAEGWYGNIGYQQFMLNVTRFRAVETRRYIARSSNKGVSTFINSIGKSYGIIASGSLDFSTNEVNSNTEITWASKYPDTFPIFSLIVIFVISLIISYKNIFQI